MKKILSSMITAVALLLLTAVSLCLYAQTLIRPISYDMVYHTEVEYGGEVFEGKMIFHKDSTLTVINTNFEEEMTSRYYYKDGYVFFTAAETDEEYEREVKYINENFDKATDLAFYAAKINAFNSVAEGLDGYTTTYSCQGAVVFAAVGGAVELVLIGLTIAAFLLARKAKMEE